MVPGLYGVEKVQPFSRGGAEARLGYETLARLIELWMRGILGDAATAAERTALLAALPAGFARYEPVAARPRMSAESSAVSFPSRDGLVVTGTLYRPHGGAKPRACMLLAHQSGSSRGEYAVIGPALARRGYLALAVDLRWGRRDRWAHEWNDTARRAGSIARLEGGDKPTFPAILAGAREDLAAAQSYLAGQGCGGVVLWGSSFSANAVLERAVEAPAATRAVVSFSPGEYDKETPEHMQSVARTVSVPVLVVWGFDEEEIGTPKILAALPGAKSGHASPTGIHGSSILFQDPAAWTALWRFLDGLPSANASAKPLN
jgi:dienelactone hydrolase